jgi:NADPH-dependent 2,4-dienoyl-CoA reductase/sulfur reductase-like enzyme
LGGHEVILLEALDHLGGQVALAATATWRREIGGVTNWLGNEIQHLGVDVRYSIYADRDTVMDLKPDVVVIATGGFPILNGLRAMNTVTAPGIF